MAKYKPEDVIIFTKDFNLFTKGDTVTVSGYKDYPSYYIIKAKSFTWYPNTEDIDPITILASEAGKLLYVKV